MCRFNEGSPAAFGKGMRVIVFWRSTNENGMTSQMFLRDYYTDAIPGAKPHFCSEVRLIR